MCIRDRRNFVSGNVRPGGNDLFGTKSFGKSHWSKCQGIIHFIPSPSGRSMKPISSFFYLWSVFMSSIENHSTSAFQMRYFPVHFANSSTMLKHSVDQAPFKNLLVIQISRVWGQWWMHMQLDLSLYSWLTFSQTIKEKIQSNKGIKQIQIKLTKIPPKPKKNYY